MDHNTKVFVERDTDGMEIEGLKVIGNEGFSVS